MQQGAVGGDAAVALCMPEACSQHSGQFCCLLKLMRNFQRFQVTYHTHGYIKKTVLIGGKITPVLCKRLKETK